MMRPHEPTGVQGNGHFKVLELVVEHHPPAEAPLCTLMAGGAFIMVPAKGHSRFFWKKA
jgi:hypothetical protein